MKASIGIDIGGTKIEIIVLDKATGAELYRNKIPTPMNSDDFLLKIRDLVDEAEKAVGTECSIGIGIPGAILKNGEVYNYNNMQFIKPNIAKELSAFINRPIRMGNDANCFALSEVTDGAAKGYDVAFCAIFGTGIGAGLAVNGQIITGAYGMTGEWGHISQPYATIDEIIAPCTCGGKGHIEALISAPAIIRDYNHICGPEEKVTDVRQIVEKAEKGNQLATATMYNFYDRTARALLCVTSILGPDVFVLGGGLSNIKDIYQEVPSRFAFLVKNLNGIKAEINIKPALHGASSGLRGAAWLWDNK